MDRNDKDEQLSAVLRDWKIDCALPPRFQDEVWRKMARGRKQEFAVSWFALTSWLESAFSRPVIAISYIAVVLIVGAITGLFHAKLKSAQNESRWRERYVQSVDPYLMPRD